jgi:hypothetical protein
MSLDRVKFVMLHQPLLCWEDKEVQRFFGLMATLKIQGYEVNYPRSKSYALDTFDWISSHFIAFTEGSEGPEPVMAYRFTSYEECLFYGMRFLGLAVFDDGTEAHRNTVREIVNKGLQKGRSITYSSAWTVNPKIRGDKAFQETLRGYLIGSHALYQNTYGVDESICTGVERFKAHLTQERIGYQLLKDASGTVLPTFSRPTLNQEKVFGLHLPCLSEESQRIAESLQFMWKAKIELGSHPTRKHSDKIAA